MVRPVSNRYPKNWILRCCCGLYIFFPPKKLHPLSNRTQTLEQNRQRVGYVLSYFHETKHLNYHAKTLASICLDACRRKSRIRMGGKRVQKLYNSCWSAIGALALRLRSSTNYAIFVPSFPRPISRLPSTSN